MQRRLPSHFAGSPLKYKTWLASAESIDPKRDRLVESIFQKTKGGPPANFFQGATKLEVHVR